MIQTLLGQHTVSIIETKETNSQVKVSSADRLTTGTRFWVSTNIGTIKANQIYYIKEIIDSTHITIIDMPPTKPRSVYSQVDAIAENVPMTMLGCITRDMLLSGEYDDV